MDKKGYLTLSISLAKDGKVLLRKPEGIRDWFQDIKVPHTFTVFLQLTSGVKTCAKIQDLIKFEFFQVFRVSQWESSWEKW